MIRLPHRYTNWAELKRNIKCKLSYSISINSSRRQHLSLTATLSPRLRAFSVCFDDDWLNAPATVLSIPNAHS